MLQLGVNKKLYPGHGGQNDIRLSLNDYKDMMVCLKDENVSNVGVMRFRNLYASSMYTRLNILLM